jgi:hypothetical protein
MMTQAHPEGGEVAGHEAGQDVQRRAAVLGAVGHFLDVPELVLTKILVNSGISAPATVPQLMMTESTHHRAGCARFVGEIAQQQ